MDKQSETISTSQSNSHWLDIAETASVFGSIGGSVASLFFKEIFLASIPLSVCVALNLVNRKRILNLTTAETHQAIAELAQENQDVHTNFSQKLTQLQQLTNNQLAKYKTDKDIISHQINRLNNDFNERSQELQKQEEELATKIEYLSQIESSTRGIEALPDSSELYCQRGNSYQQIGQKDRAIEDYTKVIELEPSSAIAYHNRGLANSELGNKKAAVEDLRRAAKFYFEQGDLENYQKTRKMSQALHELNSASQEQDSDQILAGGLFS
ncbi:MAG: tetratricopeptide repeat protein [Waterburya sp.]